MKVTFLTLAVRSGEGFTPSCQIRYVLRWQFDPQLVRYRIFVFHFPSDTAAAARFLDKLNLSFCCG